jgi:hypothetical protein
MPRTIRPVAATRPRLSLARRARLGDESGEGVISAAIAVLIMAFLGVAMWVGFQSTLAKTQRNVDNQVTRIGTSTGGNAGGDGIGIGSAGVGVGGSSGGTP